MGRINSFVAAGASKLILNPIGKNDEEIFYQTEKIISEILPLIEKNNQKRVK